MDTEPLAKTNTSLKAKVVNVKVREGKEGLFYATSPQLKGLLVAEPTLDALEAAIPKAISDLYLACGMRVLVTKVEDGDETGMTPWVAFPASVAQAALNQQNQH
jgi:hypothetical protein